MPIKREFRKFYNRAWQRLSKRLITERARNRCEWCSALNHQPHPKTGGIVRLAVAHLNQTPGDNRLENLAVLCQRCHFMLDRDTHVEHARETRKRKKDEARPLFELKTSKEKNEECEKFHDEC